MYNRKQQNTWKNGYAHRSHILFMGQYRMAVRGSDWKPDPVSRVQHQLGVLRFRFRKPTSGWYRHWRSIEWCPSLCCPEVWSVPRWFSIKICFGLLQSQKRTRPFRIPTSKFYFSSGGSTGGSRVVCDLDPHINLTANGGASVVMVLILSDLCNLFTDKNTTRPKPCATNNGYGLARRNECYDYETMIKIKNVYQYVSQWY